ncbi:zinc finger-containing protein [Starmerella bacillaris]|uniref:Zinc finger-containing protein n=1 Tax=Starmerella bacillaris TaxID=1247836 RepID=A0AAV5RH16_STABA|nr:zinc finger-containing protein [Starmerella bacillaris]
MSSNDNNQGIPNKKQKHDEEFFPTVGEQAEQVEYINADDLRTTGAEDSTGRPVREMDSLCMNCHENGVTRLLMTKIPNFKEVILTSFDCPHCGFRNSEIQSATEIQELGHEIKYLIENMSELGLQVVKSNYASVSFPDLDIEIPAGPGRVTTIDGLLGGMRDDMTRDQPVRKHIDPDLYEKIEAVIAKLNDALDGKKFPLRMVLNDPAGNSFLAHDSNDSSEKFSERTYTRNATQNRQIGLAVNEDDEHRNKSLAPVIATTEDALNHGGEFDENVPSDLREEVQTFNGSCPSCQEEVPTHMKIVNIPHFKDVIIMSTVCAKCGYKSNEVKTGGSVPDKGRRVKLEVVEREDLTRDILKSETCTLKFPELNLDLTQGTLGGRFTTIEGLLRQVYEQLETRVLQTEPGQMSKDEENRWAAFLARLQSAIDGEVLPFNIDMEDPLAASYIQNVYAPDPDPNMIVEDYERTHEENEELGLNHMKV